MYLRAADIFDSDSGNSMATVKYDTTMTVAVGYITSSSNSTSCPWTSSGSPALSANFPFVAALGEFPSGRPRPAGHVRDPSSICISRRHPRIA